MLHTTTAKSSVDLAYIYILIKVEKDGLRLHKIFQGDLNNSILSKILSKDIQLLDDEESDIHKKELIERNIIKEIGGKLYFQ